MHMLTKLFGDIALPFREYRLPITRLHKAFPIAELVIIVVTVSC